jgi:CubicO group peptidase (beta-lactamase class C family)
VRDVHGNLKRTSIDKHFVIDDPVDTLDVVERGRLELDDAVTRFLPDFAPRLPDGSSPLITVRHLLTHTAGLGYPSLEPGDPYVAARVSDGVDQPGLSMQENLQRIASAPLYFPPGSAWRYSMATDVLGAIIAVVDGGSLADAVATYVTDPLGMHDSAFVVRDRARLAVPYADGNPRAVRMGEPHRVLDVVFSPARAFDEGSFQSGGGGMVGTADDFMIYLEALRIGGAPILTRETVEVPSRNQVGSMRDQEEPGWGFGCSQVCLSIPRAGSPAAAGMLPWGGVYGNSWFMDPVAGLSVVALTNTALEGCMGAFPTDIQAAIYAAPEGEEHLRSYTT